MTQAALSREREALEIRLATSILAMEELDSLDADQAAFEKRVDSCILSMQALAVDPAVVAGKSSGPALDTVSEAGPTTRSRKERDNKAAKNKKGKDKAVKVSTQFGVFTLRPRPMGWTLGRRDKSFSITSVNPRSVRRNQKPQNAPQEARSFVPPRRAGEQMAVLVSLSLLRSLVLDW